MQSASSSPGNTSSGNGSGSDGARPSEASVRFHFRDVVSTLLPASNPLHEPLHPRPTEDEIKQDAEKQETASLIELQSPKVMIREGHGHGKEGFSPLETHSHNDPYAFKINKSHRQPTFESVSKHPWNVPLKRLDTNVIPSTRSTWLPYSLHWPLFAFPYNVNVINARIVGILVTGVCAVIIAERKQRWAYYLTLLMCADFALRFLFGGRGSFLGTVAEIPAYFFPRKWTPGPPKQFAAFCGIMFSGASTLLFFLSADDDNIAASVIIGILMGCAALEGFLDICVGCLFFQIGQKFNIFPMNNRSELVYDETERTSLEMEYEIDRQSVRPLNILVPDGERKLPLSYKSATDAQKRANFHPIKHMNGGNYLIPMGLAGLAIVWLEMTRGPYPTIPNVVWHILAVVSGCIWGALFVLHILKAVLFPHKVIAEWEHPQQRHFLCALPITVLLFAYLAQAGDEQILAEVLFWFAGPLQLLLTVLIMSSWIRHVHHEDNFTPAWMMAPLGNLVAALVLPFIRDAKFTEVAYLWLSIAIFMWVIMTTMALTRLTFRAPLDDGLRSSVFMLLAAPSVIMIAWISINSNGGMVPFALDGFARFSFYVAVVFSFVLTFLTLLGYFGRDKFSVNYWGFAFPLDTIAIAAIHYHSYMGKELTDAMATTYLVAATFIHAILAAHTVHGLISRNNGIFLGEERTGPLAWLRIFHYAVKYSMEQLNKLSGQFSHEAKVEEFCREFVNFRVALETHMRHEEEVFFPAFRSLWPGITIDADEEHDRDEELVARMHSLVDQVMSTPGTAGAGRASLLAEIEKLMPVLSQTTLDHIEHEEAHLQFMAVKYIPLSWQYRLARSMWDSTTAQDWSVVIPYLLNHQWVHGRRVKLLSSLRWALPEHIQQIGHWVYEGVDELMFDRLLVDIPELAPRHVRGHYRIW